MDGVDLAATALASDRFMASLKTSPKRAFDHVYRCGGSNRTDAEVRVEFRCRVADAVTAILGNGRVHARSRVRPRFRGAVLVCRPAAIVHPIPAIAEAMAAVQHRPADRIRYGRR